MWSCLRPLLAANPTIRASRLQGKLDMLGRRRCVLDMCFARQDAIVVAKVCLELVVLAAKVCALLDEVPFDPRKRLLTTSLNGPIGTQARRDITQMLGLLGRCALGSNRAQARYQDAVGRVIPLLKQAALSKGLEVSMRAPDRRHCEPQGT